MSVMVPDCTGRASTHRRAPRESGSLARTGSEEGTAKETESGRGRGANRGLCTKGRGEL